MTASAPTRIDLAGGTIDIWPLYLFHDGASTLNCAISLRAHVQLESRSDSAVELLSIDTDRLVSARHWSELDPVRRPAARRPARASLSARRRHADHARRVASGRRIAGSSALTIALCGALDRWTGRSTSSEHLMQLAMNVECQAIRVPTGVQDYRPAVYRRHRRSRVEGRRCHACTRESGSPGARIANRARRTQARPAILALTTGKSRNATSTATPTSSIALSGFAIRPRRCARLWSEAIGTELGTTSPRSGRTGNAWRPASRRRPSTI